MYADSEESSLFMTNLRVSKCSSFHLVRRGVVSQRAILAAVLHDKIPSD